ncbi:MAG: class I SAM-dependent methyltransferase, partial [Chloracidobacterium sp.]
MEHGEYRRMFELETTYWWFVGRRDLVRDWVAAALRRSPPPVMERKSSDVPKLLDAGCGTGANADMLKVFGWVVGTDLSSEALSWSRQRGLPALARCR